MKFSTLPVLPGVSYVMPVLNEAGHLEQAVRTILEQDYAGPKEIVLALAPSLDGTDEIASSLAHQDSRVTLVPNPERDIPIGLNIAIKASKHPVIIRVDAHSELNPTYTSEGIKVLQERSAANVGGIMRATGISPTQKAIAAAYNSPIGLGGGVYHGPGEASESESAYLGIFRREAVEAVGGYDPMIRRGEDWELNLRIRKAGGSIWFSPDLSVTYWPRENISQLSRQFFATGAWRAVLVKKYPKDHPWRFFAPAFLVMGILVSTLIGTLQISGLLESPWWNLLSAMPFVYVAVIAVAASRFRELKGISEQFRAFLVLVTMHISWGLGFLWGISFGASSIFDRSRATK